MRGLPPLSEQIAYAEGELERMLRLKPGMVLAGARPIEAVDAEIELQTGVVESLKRQERALKAIPADLDAALNGIAGEVARIRTTMQGDALRRQGCAA